eukprot:gb/GEZN01011842.1/.p1 GENE.gb/GEZN01011842.1/~~gb/GEZN01011842.1/.p1  ORF type:complete len:277 (-),score=47.34 gb/GEZN01011842.1/:227-1057(-)
MGEERPTKKAKLLLTSMDSDSEEEDEEDDIPDDFHGDPDEYRAELRAARTRKRPPADLEPKNYRVYALKKRNDLFPFKADTGSQFACIPQSVLHEVLECLDTSNLLHVAVLNRSWSHELDNDSYWACRYIQDIGEDRYRTELLRAGSHGWSAKQQLLWSMVNMATSKSPAGQRFHHQRDLWVGIMRERKRKVLAAAAKIQERKSAVVAAAQTGDKQTRGQAEAETVKAGSTVEPSGTTSKAAEGLVVAATPPVATVSGKEEERSHTTDQTDLLTKR